MGVVKAIWDQVPQEAKDEVRDEIIVPAMKSVAFIIREKIFRCVVKIINSITQFFSKIFTMMKKVVGLIEQKLNQKLEGMGHFVERDINGEFSNVYQGFHVDEVGDWNETIARKALPLDEVPEKYRQMIKESQINDTNEIEASLEM